MDYRKKGILLVMSNANGWRKPSVFGGAEFNTTSIISKIVEIEWYVVLPYQLYNIFVTKFPEQQIHYIPIKTLFLKTNILKDIFQGLVYTWKCVFMAWKQRNDYDLVYSATTNFSDIFPTKIISLITQKPYIAKYHISIYDEPNPFKIYKNLREEKNSRTDSFIRALLARITILFLKNAKNVLVVCKYLGYQLESCGVPKDKIILNYNGVDFAMMGKYKDKNLKKRYDLCYIGRIEKNKGLEDLIEVIHGFMLEGKEITAVLIGDGSFLEALRKMVKNYNLDNLVTITGFLGPERFKFLQESRIFVSPTYAKEGFGLTLLEALYFGVPILAYSHPVFIEVFNQYNTITLIDKNKEDLQANILKMLKKTVAIESTDMEIYSLIHCFATERDILLRIIDTV